MRLGVGLGLAGLAGLLSFGSAAVAEPGAANSQPAPASQSASTPQATGPAGVKEKDRIVCRSQRHTGSRFPVRTCKTKKEWDNAGREARERTARIADENRPERWRPPITID